MKYINIQTFNREFLGKIDRSRVYFNPDNSVALFTSPDDDPVLEYVTKNAEKLKQANFFMNEENYGKILNFTQQQAAECKQQEELEKSQEEEKIKQLASEVVKLIPAANLSPVEATLEARGLFSEEEFNEIIGNLDSKPSVAKLAEIVKLIVTKLQ